MNIFIDGEWNSYGGELISLALVAENGQSFYRVLGCADPDPWVAENVMPKLHEEWVTLDVLQSWLEVFLNQFDSVHIIADWPEDIMWFCKVLVNGPGTRLDTPPLTMQVLRIDTVSKNPHNALADAIALRDWYVSVDMNSAGIEAKLKEKHMTQEEMMADGTQYCCYCGCEKARFQCCGENHFQTFAQMSAEEQDEFLDNEPWVGLTADEIWSVYKQVDSMQYVEFAHAIEAKLKEKNNG